MRPGGAERSRERARVSVNVLEGTLGLLCGRKLTSFRPPGGLIVMLSVAAPCVLLR